MDTRLLDTTIAIRYPRAVEIIHALRLHCPFTDKVVAVADIEMTADEMLASSLAATEHPLMRFVVRCPLCRQDMLIIGDSTSEPGAFFVCTCHGHNRVTA